MIKAIARRRDDLLVRDLGSEMILYDPESETYHVLNPTARHIWVMIDGARAPEDVQHELSQRYRGVDPGILAKDVLRAVKDFRKKGLLDDH